VTLLRALLAAWLVLGAAGCSSLVTTLFGPANGGPVTSPGSPAAARGAQWGDPPGGRAAPAPDNLYRIGPEDGLEIAVWRDDTLKSTVIVRPDGGISFPLVGDVPVAGKTAAEVREELTRRLDKFVPDPVVNVTVVRIASLRVYVLGRVARPGDFPVGRHIDVLQALALAGGLTPFADEGAIRIVRRVDGRSVSIPFDYSRVRKHSDLSQNIVLQGGDVLIVP
jgi:polysaccharide biosynthesis/export protein